LIGPDHPIEEKISSAIALHENIGRRLLEQRDIRRLLEGYETAIEETWRVMEEVGVVSICTACATRDGGSCCGRGIENRFDEVLLLINLLMGSPLPLKPWDETGCWFLGKTGCRIKARHTICVNYLCPRLTMVLEKKDLSRLQEAIGQEVALGFLLEDAIKKWLLSIDR